MAAPDRYEIKDSGLHRAIPSLYQCKQERGEIHGTGIYMVRNSLTLKTRDDLVESALIHCLN